MKYGSHFLFLEQKLRVLQATDDFAFQLEKAKECFDYTLALKIMGNKAIGLKYFYWRSMNLINWIYGHRAFRNVLKRHKVSEYRERANFHTSDLSSAFVQLQLTASQLLQMILGALKKLEKNDKSKILKKDHGYFRSQHILGIDILITLINAKPEQYWTDMYEQGFKNKTYIN